jgi:hypothetical protein
MVIIESLKTCLNYCSESEGSGSEGNCGSSNEGGSTSKNGTSSASNTRVSVSGGLNSLVNHSFTFGESRYSEVNLIGSLLRLVASPSVSGTVVKTDTTRGVNAKGRSRGGGRTVNGKLHVPFSESNFGSGGDSKGISVLSFGERVDLHSRNLRGGSNRVDTHSVGSNGNTTTTESSISHSNASITKNGKSNLVTIRVGRKSSSFKFDGISEPSGS